MSHRTQFPSLPVPRRNYLKRGFSNQAYPFTSLGLRQPIAFHLLTSELQRKFAGASLVRRP